MIAAHQLADRVMAKYKLHYDTEKGFVAVLGGAERVISRDQVTAIMDAEISLIRREEAEDALIAEHEIMYAPETNQFRLKLNGKKRLMSPDEIRKFLDTKLKSLGY
jgi:hypothetical protein